MIFNFSDSTSLYFFSALFQGNAALIALVAVFLVYRLQTLDSSFDKIERVLIGYLEKSGLKINYGNIFDLEHYADTKFSNLDGLQKAKLKEDIENDPWKSRFSELRIIDNSRKGLWGHAAPTIRLVFILLMASILMLPLSSWLHLYENREILVFAIFLTGQGVSVFLLYRFIRSQLV